MSVSKGIRDSRYDGNPRNGSNGPIPKREAERVNPAPKHKPISKGELREVVWPEPDPDWHPTALRMWEALPVSGQVHWYQQTDIAYAWFVCEELSRYCKSNKRSAMMLTALDKAMTSLMLTEVERRKVRIELHDGADDEGSNPELALVMDMMRTAQGKEAAG